MAFDAYFSDAAGNKLGKVWEGQQIYIAIKDPEKGACGIDEFQADLVIFDFKTGAYIEKTGVYFRELGGIGSGLYFWVTASKSNTKQAVPIGWRADFTSVPAGMTHVLQPSSVTNLWQGGAWEYVDEDVLGGSTASVGLSELPQNRKTARVDFASVSGKSIKGRFENNDTLILIVADKADAMKI
ncbi:MAG: hypothetical protein H5U01_15775, partial [Clostridia bacterium]|nr:hypothetical protein [Clostridia bacterium]